MNSQQREHLDRQVALDRAAQQPQHLRLASLVLSHHDDHHEGPAQWCFEHCRVAREQLGEYQ